MLEVALTYPVTTEVSDHPGGYEAALAEFYDASAAQLTEHLDAGRDVAVLCEGDPFFYGSYMYLHERLAARYATEVVPGVTSFSAAAAAAGTPLCKRDDVLTVLPAPLGHAREVRLVADQLVGGRQLRVGLGCQPVRAAGPSPTTLTLPARPLRGAGTEFGTSTSDMYGTRSPASASGAMRSASLLARST